MPISDAQQIRRLTNAIERAWVDYQKAKNDLSIYSSADPEGELAWAWFLTQEINGKIEDAQEAYNKWMIER